MFVYYFYEAQVRFFYILFYLVFTWLVSFFFSNQLLYLLTLPLKSVYLQNNPSTLFHFIFTDLTQVFFSQTHLASFLTCFFFFPIFFYQFWLFVKPGLFLFEKHFFLLFFFFFFFITLFSLFFTYFFFLPWACHFFLSFESLSHTGFSIYLEATLDKYLSFVLHFFFSFYLFFLFHFLFLLPLPFFFFRRPLFSPLPSTFINSPLFSSYNFFSFSASASRFFSKCRKFFYLSCFFLVPLPFGTWDDFTYSFFFLVPLFFFYELILFCFFSIHVFLHFVPFNSSRF